MRKRQGTDTSDAERSNRKKGIGEKKGGVEESKASLWGGAPNFAEGTGRGVSNRKFCPTPTNRKKETRAERHCCEKNGFRGNNQKGRWPRRYHVEKRWNRKTQPPLLYSAERRAARERYFI